MERILEERFHLKYHNANWPLPGYVVTVAKDGLKLAEAKDPTEPGGCQAVRQKDDPARVITTCTSETIPQFLTLIGGTFRHPLLDRTGLTKPYDFTLRFTFEQLSTRQDSINAYIEEMNKQLGIVMTLGDVPQPALVVDHVDRTPTANPPETAKLIPVTPELEAEVASIRVADPKEPQAQMRPAGSQIALSNFSLQQLVVEAWQLPLGRDAGRCASVAGSRALHDRGEAAAGGGWPHARAPPGPARQHAPEAADRSLPTSNRTGASRRRMAMCCLRELRR